MSKLIQSNRALNSAPGPSRSVSGPQPVSKPAPVDSSAPSQDPAELDHPSLTRELVSAVPPWLISLSFHIVAILALAIFVFSPPEGTRSVDLDAQFEEALTPEVLDVEISTEELDLVADTSQMTSSTDSGLEEFEDTELQAENPRIVRTGDFASAFAVEGDLIPYGHKAKGGKAEGENGDGKKKGEANGAATFYGIKAEGETFVYVLDNSGSMAGIRWIQACNELVRSINSLNEKQKFLVVLYNSHTDVMLGQRGRGIECLQATAENREKVVKWLSKRMPQLDTFPLGSMKVALRVKPDAVFLLSDGEFRDGTLEFLRKANLDIERQKVIANRGMYMRATHCRIHTIAFKSFIGAPLLRQIAHENNGTFRYVK